MKVSIVCQFLISVVLTHTSGFILINGRNFEIQKNSELKTLDIPKEKNLLSFLEQKSDVPSADSQGPTEKNYISHVDVTFSTPYSLAEATNSDSTSTPQSINSENANFNVIFNGDKKDIKLEENYVLNFPPYFTSTEIPILITSTPENIQQYQAKEEDKKTTTIYSTTTPFSVTEIIHRSELKDAFPELQEKTAKYDELAVSQSNYNILKTYPLPNAYKLNPLNPIDIYKSNREFVKNPKRETTNTIKIPKKYNNLANTFGKPNETPNPENGEKLAQAMERFRQVLNIFGQMDSYVSNRLKTSIRKLAQLCDDEETLL